MIRLAPDGSRGSISGCGITDWGLGNGDWGLGRTAGHAGRGTGAGPSSAPTGPGGVAAGGAQPAARRAERNPWEKCVCDGPAPSGRSGAKTRRLNGGGGGISFAPPGRKEEDAEPASRPRVPRRAAARPRRSTRGYSPRPRWGRRRPRPPSRSSVPPLPSPLFCLPGPESPIGYSAPRNGPPTAVGG